MNYSQTFVTEWCILLIVGGPTKSLPFVPPVNLLSSYEYLCAHLSTLSWLGVAMAMMGWVSSVPRRSLFLTKTNTGDRYKDKYKDNYKDKYNDSWLGVAMAMVGWVASVPRWTDLYS